MYLTQQEEETLLKSYLNHGDIEARDRLLDDQMSTIYKNAASFSKDRQVIEELVQRGVLALLSKLKNFKIRDDKTRLVTWATFTIRAPMYLYFKNRGTDLTQRAQHDHEFTLENISFSEEGKVEHEQLCERLVPLLKKLPPRDKRIIKAFFFENMSKKQGTISKLALKEGISTQRIHQRRNYILENLRKKIGARL